MKKYVFLSVMAIACQAQALTVLPPQGGYGSGMGQAIGQGFNNGFNQGLQQSYEYYNRINAQQEQLELMRQQVQLQQQLLQQQRGY